MTLPLVTIKLFIQLQQRIKSLISENEELVAQKEYSETQSGQVINSAFDPISSQLTLLCHTQSQQAQSRQLAEVQAQIKAKEV